MASEAFPFSQSSGSIGYYQERWLSRSDPVISRWAYIETVRNFGWGVKMVAGEANGKLFNREELVSVLTEGLREHPQATVELVFHKDDDKARACIMFEEENSLMIRLKREFSDRVHIFWAPKRPRQHYAVVDDERVIFEQPNHPPNKPWWGNIVMNTSIAQEWERRFDEYVRYCSELQF